MADRVLRVIDNHVHVAVAGGPLVAALAGSAAAAAAQPYVDQAEAAAAAALANYLDALAIQALGDDAAAIAARAAKAANGSDFADKEVVTQNLLFLQEGAGALPRSLRSKMRDVVSVRDHDTLQETVDSFDLLGGEIELPAGEQQAVTAGAGDACLTITTPISMVGKGGTYAAITPDSSTASDATLLKYEPNGIEGGLIRLQNVYLGNYSDGTREGDVGINIRTVNDDVTADRILFDGVFVGNSGGLAFLHENDTVANPTGGLFCSEFRRCAFNGGMKFDSSGDSLLFTSNTTTGPNIGVEFEGTISPAGDGPSQVVFINHNSTSVEGAFLFHRAKFPTIQNANMEQTQVNSGGVMVDFLGDTGPETSTAIWAPSLTNSLVSSFAGVDLASLVNYGSVSGGVNWNNVYLDGGGTTGTDADIVVSNETHDLWIGPNLSDRTDVIIVDDGVGTRGVSKAVPLSGSWALVGGAEPLQFMKSLDGIVTVWGVCANGNATGQFGLLPPGFRPSGYLRFLMEVNDDGTQDVGKGLLLDTGELIIATIPTVGGPNSQQLHISFSFRAAHANTIKIPPFGA